MIWGRKCWEGLFPRADSGKYGVRRERERAAVTDSISIATDCWMKFQFLKSSLPRLDILIKCWFRLGLALTSELPHPKKLLSRARSLKTLGWGHQSSSRNESRPTLRALHSTRWTRKVSSMIHPLRLSSTQQPLHLRQQCPICNTLKPSILSKTLLGTWNSDNILV
jgi:hypothetical protein